jgi:nucleolar protein 4
VRYARIVYDKTTKRSRGTAFVCFYREADALEVLKEAEKLELSRPAVEVSTQYVIPFTNYKLTIGLRNFEQKSERGQPSLLTADPSSETASKLSLHGRVLGVSRAVSRDEADKLREDRDKKGVGKTDRRNLYLMREGGTCRNADSRKKKRMVF